MLDLTVGDQLLAVHSRLTSVPVDQVLGQLLWQGRFSVHFDQLARVSHNLTHLLPSEHAFLLHLLLLAIWYSFFLLHLNVVVNLFFRFFLLDRKFLFIDSFSSSQALLPELLFSLLSLFLTFKAASLGLLVQNLLHSSDIWCLSKATAGSINFCRKFLLSLLLEPLFFLFLLSFALFSLLYKFLLLLVLELPQLVLVIKMGFLLKKLRLQLLELISSVNYDFWSILFTVFIILLRGFLGNIAVSWIERFSVGDHFALSSPDFHGAFFPFANLRSEPSFVLSICAGTAPCSFSCLLAFSGKP